MMDKLIAHVFPDFKQAYAHLHDIWDREDVLEVDKTHLRYKERGGTVHKCLVVRARDDIYPWLGIVFFAHELHGSFSHLPPEDDSFMRGMLIQRTRHVPEAV